MKTRNKSTYRDNSNMHQLIHVVSRKLLAQLMLASALIFALGAMPASAEVESQGGESAQILQDFNKQHQENEHAKSITDKDKQVVMFIMGVALLVMVLITGGLGLALGVYGKPVFVTHMVFAALSVTLAIAHAIVGLVWYYPF